ncbi:MAG: HDOD domain-containing protein [Deltaproteobacteria bacterium]|nr:HDOD domain-containing protein [Deltaproteobacteria bacterium]
MHSAPVAPRPQPPQPLDLDAAIVDVVGRGAVKVPPYPAVAMKVDKLVKREDYGLDELTKLVASDQALAADALRCANSAFFSRGMPVTSLVQAITRIGGKEMARLAIASGLGAHARAPGPLASLKRRIWLDGLAGAALCQELARKRLLDVEEAFVCGLLHDFGRMIAVACVEEILAAHPGQRAMPLEYWLGVVDRYHVELGLVLAAKWDLPQMVSDVISLHHTDPQGAEEPRMVELVMAADEVVRMLGESISLTAEDLGAISLLSGPECELVSRVLDRLPAFIASFEGDAPAAAPGQSLVEAELPQEEGMAGPRPVDFPVEIVAGRDRRVYRAMGIATNNLMVNGPTPLPENVLLQVELRSDPPISCWASAKVSWPENGGHTVLLQPFALNGKAHESWKEILRKTVEPAG